MQCGPIRHSVDAKSAAKQRPFAHAVHVRPTSFLPPDSIEQDLRRQYQQLCHELLSNDARNQLICADAVQCTREGRSPLVLTQRKDHLQLLASALEDSGPKVVILHGGRGVRAIRETTARLAAIPPTEPRILLATGAYLGEGFDDPRLDTLLLALPVSWRGTIAQYVGRLHRLREGKTEVRVIDYADLDVPMLARMFQRRCRAYEAAGYQVLLPGSAIAGWPAEVPLPIDPAWKQQFSATIGRLVRDGVDRPLARLFVDAVEAVPADAAGVARARSAAEAFFYQRLETLPAAAGRFRLNAALAIPWDGCGKMEVDLLCEDARLAIEIDGAQHLDSCEAYRRDRRKDLLLQQHGYLVMRFLAADVAPRLDEILDQLLRTLASRSSCR
jgi:very-short-patch-repair endonuclease